MTDEPLGQGPAPLRPAQPVELRPVDVAGRPPQGPPPQDIGQNAGVRLLVPVGRCGYAIAAGYLALLSLLPFVGVALALASIVLGVIAHRRIRRDPQLHGMGRVIFAYVMSGIVLAFYLVMLYAYLRGRFG